MRVHARSVRVHVEHGTDRIGQKIVRWGAVVQKAGIEPEQI